MTIGEGLKLDVTTRWNSTYNMLKIAIACKDALDSYADTDANYKWKPTNDECALFDTITPILARLAAFFGSTYPTRVDNYGEAMMDKFNKYWEEPNSIMVIATVLDPRYNLKHIKWDFYKIYGREKAAAEYELIDIEVRKLYERYDMHHQHEKADSYRESASSSKTMDTSVSLP